MKRTWSHFLKPLRLGVRTLLALLLVLYLVAVIGHLTRAYDLYGAMALSPPAFWKGRVWQAVTYAFLPATIIDFLVNGFMIAWLGTWLERVWSRMQLWGYCLIAALGAGLAKVVLMPSTRFLMVGTAGVVFGLLAAWARLFGHERVLMMGAWEMSVPLAALLMAAFSLVLMLPCAGPVNAFIMLCGGIAGWLYLSVRFKTIRAQPGQLVANERMNRLEL